jgi:heavy metal sensor kinase
MNLSNKNVRFRLTLWYSVTLLVILVLYAGITIMMTWLNLRNSLDRHLEKDYEVIEEMVEVSPSGKVHLDEDDQSFLEERWVEIWSLDGEILYNSRPFSGKALPSRTPDLKVMELTFSSIITKTGVRLRSLTGRANIEGHEFIFRLFRPEATVYAELKKFILLLLIGLPLALIIAACGGYLLAGRLLAPVDKMTETARQISDSNLHERLPVENPSDELGRLAITLNELLDRLQDAFERLKQFTYDAAHELRTPLTAIRSTGEVALQKPQDPATYREIIGSILEENNRLTNLVNSLLFLSRADSDNIELKKEEVELSALITQTIELIHPLAEEKGQEIHFSPSGTVTLELDKTLFRQSLLNLLDNAIKYAPEESTITIGLHREDDRIRIVVTDEGTPIPEKQHEKIFERFFRLDKSRSKESGGSGLGLAIAKWAVEIQGGTLFLMPGKEKGNSFVIIFQNTSSKTTLS